MTSDPAFDPAPLNELKEELGMEMLSALFDEFQEEARSRAAGLKTAAAEGDLNLLQQEAHRLKSSSGAVGCLAIQRLCADIELQARDGDAAAASSGAVVLDALLKDGIARVHQWLDAQQA